MKSLSYLDLFNLNEIDEIYISQNLNEKIYLPQTKFIKIIKDINEIKNNKKKLLFLFEFKYFLFLLKNKTLLNNSVFLLFNSPIFLNKDIKRKYCYKTYYLLPNIYNPEIIIMKKDLKYLSRYWSNNNNNIFKNLYLYISYFLLKYKLALFFIPRIIILNEK